MIFLMQPGLTKVLDKYRIQKTITTGEDEFIPFIGCSFYEMEINDKLNFGEEIMSAIDNIIAKQIKYTYADLIITIPRLSMETILFTFNSQLVTFNFPLKLLISTFIGAVSFILKLFVK